MNNIIRSFSFLRFPLAVFVIMQHMKITGFTEIYFFDNLLYGLLKAIARVAVPCFYIISGFFFFLNVELFDNATYKNKIFKRIKSLFIPYILWNLICYIVLLTKDLITGNPTIHGGLLHIETFFSSFFLFNSGTTPISAPMWFLRDLIIVVFITPLIYLGLKRVPFVFLSLLLFLFFTYKISPLYIIYPAQPYTAPLFFSIGSYVSINKNKNTISHFAIRKWMLLLSVFMFLFLFLWNLYIDNFLHK